MSNTSWGAYGNPPSGLPPGSTGGPGGPGGPSPGGPGGPGGPGEEQPGLPWENRARLGFGAALVQTVKGVLLEPNATFRIMKKRGGLGDPLGYGVLLGSLG